MKRAIATFLVLALGVSFFTIISVYASDEISDEIVVAKSGLKDFRWDLEKKDAAAAKKSPVTQAELQSLVKAISFQTGDIKKLNVLGEFVYFWSRRTIKYDQIQAILEKLISAQAKADASLMLNQIVETGAEAAAKTEVQVAINQSIAAPLL